MAETKIIDELKKQYEIVKNNRPKEVELIKAYEAVIADLTPKEPKVVNPTRFVFGL